ncbi:hypothetical protein ABZ759_29705 [Streptomyces sp. NPDC047860]|uniref:hypothetical protein n=1 Tax=Streptomyces sp. NPDC047860 TaxID=3155743 RepID=UPI0033F65304
MPIPKWKIKGIVDDITECGCCGRRGLKRTVALMPLDADGNEDGTAEDVVYYGTSCAATALSWTQGKVTDTARGPGRAGPARRLRPPDDQHLRPG